MKNITIFGLWVLTVIVGSFLFATGIFIMASNNNLEYFFGVVLGSIIISALFSIPAVITFLVRNNNLIKKHGNTSEYRRKMYKIHLLTGGLYFMTAMFLVLLEGADAIGMTVVCGLLVSYLPAGLISWYIFFEKSKNKKNETSEDIIDDFVNE